MWLYGNKQRYLTILLLKDVTSYAFETLHAEYGDSNQNTPPLTVFINGIAFDASIWPLNVKTMFGEKVVLLDSSGQPVPADQHGFVLKKS